MYTLDTKETCITQHAIESIQNRICLDQTYRVNTFNWSDLFVLDTFIMRRLFHLYNIIYLVHKATTNRCCILI